jgi:hypothetical protein
MAPRQDAAEHATCRRLDGNALRLLRRHAGQSGISSTAKSLRKLLRNVLSRLHPGARWLLRGRGGLTGRRPLSSARLRTAGLFYKSKLPRRKTAGLISSASTYVTPVTTAAIIVEGGQLLCKRWSSVVRPSNTRSDPRPVLRPQLGLRR